MIARANVARPARPPESTRQAPGWQGGSPPTTSEGTPPGARRAARRPIEQARGRLHGLTLPVGPSYGEATQRRIKRTTKDHIRIAKMPYAAGYEGFSAASKQKRTRIICTLGPASWCIASVPHRNPATTAGARNDACHRPLARRKKGQPAPATARAHSARTPSPPRPTPPHALARTRHRRDRRRTNAGPSRCSACCSTRA